MFRTKLYAGVWILLICSAVSLSAQQAALTAANTVVPPLVKFSGVLTDVNNRPLTGTVGVTFSLYKDQEGGAPLWMETQNVTLDKAGHYTVSLGSTTSQGLPASPFAAGEARWLAVQVQGQAEQPRVLLMSVPYALKALDAETIGGKPLSALQLAAPNGGSSFVSTRITHPSPTPLLVPPHPRANQATFPYLRATAEPQRSKIRSSRKVARPLASLAAQASPDQSAHQRQAAVAPRLWGTTTPAGARLQSPVRAQTALE